MVGASTADKIDLKRAVAGCRDGVTDYGITRFFGGSNAVILATEYTGEHTGMGYPVCLSVLCGEFG
jgi:hypothetical protein